MQRFDTLGGLVAETARITALETQLTAEGAEAARHARYSAAARERGRGGDDASSEEVDEDDETDSLIRLSEIVNAGAQPLELRSLTLWAPGTQPEM